jgi:hypothetical protein
MDFTRHEPTKSQEQFDLPDAIAPWNNMFCKAMAQTT